MDPTVGSEITKTRICVVVMNDPNGSSPVTIICPLTSANGRPGNLLNPLVPVGSAGTTKESRVACNEIRTLDKTRRVGERLGTMPIPIMEKISAGLRAILDL